MEGASRLPLPPPNSVADSVEELPDRAPFVDKVREGFGPVDPLALSAVPVALLAVFSLPLETRRSLAFDYVDPTLVTAFTAHYVHLGTAHLVGFCVGFLTVYVWVLVTTPAEPSDAIPVDE